MANLGVLASGTGTNFVALCDAVFPSPHTLSCLVCNVPGAPVAEKAESRGVPTYIIEYPTTARQEAESEIAAVLESHSVDVIALAGFMRILSPRFVNRFRGILMNVHPSLLPRHPGRNAIQRSWLSEDRDLGVTVHLVDEGVDTGPILAQHSFRRDEVKTMAEAEARIHEIEHQLFPATVLQMLNRSDMAKQEQ